MGRVNFKNSQDRLTGGDCYKIFWTRATIAIEKYFARRGHVVKPLERTGKVLLIILAVRETAGERPSGHELSFLALYILRHMLTLRTVWMQLFCFHQETKVLLIEIGWDFL